MRYLSLLLLVFISAARAETTLPKIFSDHMVLQQGIKVPVWGWAAPGEKVSVKFGGQEKSATADGKGNWKVALDVLKANAAPQSLTVTGTNSIEIKDVLVGEVWVCSGQSNMQWSVGQSANPAEEKASAKYPGIRMINVARKTSPDNTVNDVAGAWMVTTPESVSSFSAVGYFFGRHLHQQLDVPVGLINTSWGGTRSEAWTSLAALNSEPAAAPIIDGWKEKRAAHDPATIKAKYDMQVAKWQEQVNKVKAKSKAAVDARKAAQLVEVAKAKAAGREPKAAIKEKPKKLNLPRKPRMPQDPGASQHHHSTLYNAMIAPLVPYGIKGSIWYQGESNANRAKQYETIFPLMIKDWRNQWKQGTFPFYFVQLANFKAPSKEPGVSDSWAELQWSQVRTLQLENTGMATINDIGEARNIHPKNKQDVGKRLALWALNKDYGKDLVYSGPLYKGHTVRNGKVTIEFDQATGLKSRDGAALKRFEIAGEDKKWFWADAVIEGETVAVSSSDVPMPVAVRYAWASNPEGANLVNGEGLPASIFKTDDWEWSTATNVNP